MQPVENGFVLQWPLAEPFRFYLYDETGQMEVNIFYIRILTLQPLAPDQL